MDAIDTIKILGSLLGSGALSKGSGGSVLGNILGSALGGSAQQPTQGGGMLGDILGGLIGGGQQSTSGGSMADILGGLLGGGRGQPSGGSNGSIGGVGDLGNMADMLGKVLGGGGSSSQTAPSGGGLGDLLGGILGGGAQSGSQGGGGLGDLFSGALTKYAQVQNKDAHTPDANDFTQLPVGVDPQKAAEEAELIIRAMINAAKSDGSIDRQEQEKIIAKLGDLTQAEVDFIRREFEAPLDVDAFIQSIPRGMEQQIYTVSLMAIDLDSNKEARYLGELAKGLRIQPELANQIHDQLGAPKIFS